MRHVHIQHAPMEGHFPAQLQCCSGHLRGAQLDEGGRGPGEKVDGEDGLHAGQVGAGEIGHEGAVEDGTKLLLGNLHSAGRRGREER